MEYEFKIDRSKIVVRKGKLGELENDLEYWLSQPVEYRLAAVEFLRKQYIHNHLTNVEPRLQRVYRIIKHS